MHLLDDVIEELEKELEQRRGERYACVFGEFIPIGRTFEEEEWGVKLETGFVEKMKRMSSSYLSIDSFSGNNRRDGEIEEIEGGGELNRQKKEKLFLESKSLSGGAAFVPFKGSPTISANCKDEKLDFPEKLLHAPATDSEALALSASADGRRASGSSSKASERVPLKTDDHRTSSLAQHQAPIKVRRCWSPELHRRFLSAVKQLGGVQAVTPKQIRELMKVDGLTIDQVKSHLQKYRSHARKVSASSDSENQAIPVVGGRPSGS